MKKRSKVDVKCVGKYFNTKNNLTAHVTSVHEGNKPFKCEECDYSCSIKNLMKLHVASVHEGKKTFKE